MAEEKIGTENLKNVLGTFIDVGILAYKEYKDDNKLDTGEAIKLAFKIPAIWGAIKDFKEAVPEAKDLDPVELEDLMNFILEKFKALNVP